MSLFEPGSRGRLKVRAPEAQIAVQDSALRPVEGIGALGSFDEYVGAGAYRVTARIGPVQEVRLVVVQPDDVTLVSIDVPVSSPIPSADRVPSLPGRRDPGSTSSAIVIVPRPPQEIDRLPPAVFTAWQRKQQLFLNPVLVDARGRTTPLRRRDVGWGDRLAPGGYRLRWQLPGGPDVEQALWLAPGQQATLFVPVGVQEGPTVPGTSIHLRPAPAAGRSGPAFDPVVDALLAHLRDGVRGKVEITSLESHLSSPDPMVALLSLHVSLAALRAEGWDPGDPVTRERVPGIVKESARRMAGSGSAHPDLVPVALALGLPLPEQPVDWPPMLTSSLELLLAIRDPAMFPHPPGGLTERITGQRYSSAPWLLWDPAGLDPAPPSRRSGASWGLIAAGAVAAVSGLGVLPEAAFAGAALLAGGGLAGVVGGIGGYRRRLPPPPSLIARRRVDELLASTGEVLKLDRERTSDLLGPVEIGRRLGMAPRLVELCLAQTGRPALPAP